MTPSIPVMRVLIAVVLATVSSVPARAAASSFQGAGSRAPAFTPAWTALIGDWVGQGGGSPGTGGGAASLQFDLEERAIVRRNVSDYPATGGTPAVHREDLMVIYPTTASGEAAAFYVDNEGQTNQYTGSWSPDGRVLTFESAAGGAGPRFRLVYTFTAGDTMSVSFAIAAPGSLEFKPYVGGAMKRSPPK